MCVSVTYTKNFLKQLGDSYYRLLVNLYTTIYLRKKECHLYVFPHGYRPGSPLTRYYFNEMLVINGLSKQAAKTSSELEKGLSKLHHSASRNLFTRFHFSTVKILHFVNLCKLKEMKQIKEPTPTLNIVQQYLR